MNEDEKRALPRLRHAIVGEVTQQGEEPILGVEAPRENQSGGQSLFRTRVPNSSRQECLNVFDDDHARGEIVSNLRYDGHKQVSSIPGSGFSVVFVATIGARGTHSLTRRTRGQQRQPFLACSLPKEFHDCWPRCAEITKNGTRIRVIQRCDVQAPFVDLRENIESELGLRIPEVTRAAIRKQADGA